MKRIAIILFIVFILVGCKKSSSKIIELEFDSSPSSDYTWTYEIADPNVLKIDENFDIDDKCVSEEECFGKQIFNIIGIQEGNTKITFKYSNPNNVRYTKVYNIKVFKDLTLEEINK